MFNFILLFSMVCLCAGHFACHKLRRVVVNSRILDKYEDITTDSDIDLIVGSVCLTSLIPVWNIFVLVAFIVLMSTSEDELVQLFDKRH